MYYTLGSLKGPVDIRMLVLASLVKQYWQIECPPRTSRLFDLRQRCAMKKKKPDQVVYNEDSQRYDASLKPYSTNLGAPAITTPDTTAWKLRNIDQVNKQVGARYAELKQQYDSLMEQSGSLKQGST